MLVEVCVRMVVYRCFGRGAAAQTGRYIEHNRAKAWIFHGGFFLRQMPDFEAHLPALDLGVTFKGE